MLPSDDPSVVVAAALELARLAAQVLDEVEDGDAGDALWLSSGVPQAVNVGSGLIFASLLALSRLRDCGVAPEIVAALQAEFVRTGFRMCQGQHLDLIAEAEDNLSLEGYWQIAQAKTGAFLELGCRTGALLGGAVEACPEQSAGLSETTLMSPGLSETTLMSPGPEPAEGVAEGLSKGQRACPELERRDEIAPYAGYGYHLGLLVQIVNDLGGLLDEEGRSDLVRHKKTLPLIYALSVAGENEGERLRRAWAEAPYDAEACREVRRLVVELGALQYVFVQAELHYRQALNALQQARGDPEALAGLRALLDQYRLAALLQATADDRRPTAANWPISGRRSAVGGRVHDNND